MCRVAQAKGRKQHNYGWKHRENFRLFYAQVRVVSAVWARNAASSTRFVLACRVVFWMSTRFVLWRVQWVSWLELR